MSKAYQSLATATARACDGAMCQCNDTAPMQLCTSARHSNGPRQYQRSTKRLAACVPTCLSTTPQAVWLTEVTERPRDVDLIVNYLSSLLSSTEQPLGEPY